MSTVIEAINVSKDFRDFWGRVKVKALDQLTLGVQQGEIFGFLGPNGCGKTTTIKLFLGLLFPSNGVIRIFGNSPRNVAIKRRIGFLPEESYLYPYQNAQEALHFYGRLFGFSRKLCAKRADELLEMVGLFRVRHRPMKEYSKGMARRIGIAQALINDPDLIFLDEPTSGLDPIGNREVKDLIINLKKHGKTLFLSSHLLADVEDICDRIAILYGGKIQAMGTVDELLSKPAICQLSIENLSENMQDQLLIWLSQHNIHNISRSIPREKLEAFFLRVVEEARAKNLSTSGAEAGKSKETLFSDVPPLPKKNQIIEELLQPSRNVSSQVAQRETPIQEERILSEEKSIITELVHSSRQTDTEPIATDNSLGLRSASVRGQDTLGLRSASARGQDTLGLRSASARGQDTLGLRSASARGLALASESESASQAAKEVLSKLLQPNTPKKEQS